MLNFSLLTSTLSQVNRLVSTERGSHLRDLQYCLLRVLRSNFLRVGEQLKTADEVGLVYSPLIPHSLQADGRHGKGSSGIEGGDVTLSDACLEADMSHLVVFQLLQAVLFSLSLSGKEKVMVVYS